ncbi:MAG: 30S ribosomal protein S6, partial [Patescibacteria group bacterium]|nr:30S ribosomal protein S6 [Patescibacteria group bacterium]
KLRDYLYSGSIIRMEKEEKEGQNEKEAGIYELGFLLVPTIPEEKTGEEVSKVKDAVGESGLVISGGDAAMITLAYPMTKALGGKNSTFASGYFGSLIFQTGSDSIDAVKAALTKNDRLLRFLIIKRTKESLLPSARKPISAKEKDPVGEKTKDAQTSIQRAVHEEEIDKAVEELIAQ